MLLTAVIATHEEKDIAVLKILILYLSGDMDEEAIMILEGRLSELMEMVAPEIYRYHIHVNGKNKKVL